MPALFSEGMRKVVWRFKISCFFINHYKISENQENIFCFSQCFGGNLEGVGTLCPPHSIYIQKPLGLISSMINLFIKEIRSNFRVHLNPVFLST